MWQRFGRAGRRGGLEHRRARDVERAARPVPRARAAVPARRAGRGGAHRSGQRRDPRPAPEVRGLRAALQARRRVRLARRRRDGRRARLPRDARGAPRGARHVPLGGRRLPGQRRLAPERRLGQRRHHRRERPRRSTRTAGAPEALAEIDWRGAHTMLHEQAIYQHDGECWQVERFDYENHKAFVRKVEPDYYTDAMTYVQVALLEESATGTLVRAIATAAAHRRGRAAGARWPSWRRSSGTRRSSSTRTRTRATATCGSPRCRCTRRRSGSRCPRRAWSTSRRAERGGHRRAARDRHRARDGRDARAHVRPARLRRGDGRRGRRCGRRCRARRGRRGRRGRRRAAAGRSAATTRRSFSTSTSPGGTGLSERIFEQRDVAPGERARLIARCPCEAGCPACVGPSDATVTPTGELLTRKALARDLLKNAVPARTRASLAWRDAGIVATDA